MIRSGIERTCGHGVYRNILFEFIWAPLGFFISNLAHTNVHPGDLEK